MVIASASCYDAFFASGYEKKENKPSLRLFTKMLDVLGYELMIVKKVK